MMASLRRATRALRLRPGLGPTGRSAGFAAGIRARYTVAGLRARRTARVFRRSTVPYVLSPRSHQEHVHVYPMLHRHTLTRVTNRAPLTLPAPARPGPMRTPITLRRGRPARVGPTNRTVPRPNRPAPTAMPLPPPRAAHRPEAHTAQPSPRRPGTRAALTPASRFTARMAPATTAPNVVHRAEPPREPATPPRAVEALAEARQDRTPWSDPVATRARDAGQGSGLDLDAVTGEVLRRIERRAIAQRERLGRGIF